MFIKTGKLFNNSSYEIIGDNASDVVLTIFNNGSKIREIKDIELSQAIEIINNYDEKYLII